MNKSINLLILMIILIWSCKPLEPYKSKYDLIGNWHCRTIEITTPTHNKVVFAIRKYGYADYTIAKDSSYSFSMGILSDVVLEKEALGNSYAKTIIQAGYKNFRRGFYYATNNNIIFYDANKIKVNEENYFFTERTLFTKYLDKDNKQWLISWEKEN
jgi:hypothetical protein